MKGMPHMRTTAVYTCDNCGHQEAAPPAARDLDERLDEGGVFTDRECSRCGALSYEGRLTEIVESGSADLARDMERGK